MSAITKIASLNLCLGLKNKKEEVKRLIIDNEIDILCMQEIEIQSNYPIALLSFSGYNFECENNDLKARCGIYISNSISYVRRLDIETENLHVVIIDLNDQSKTRIINLYRTFNPQNGQTQKQFFETQMLSIENLITANTILLGDFNLDHKKRFDITYSHKHYFTTLNNILHTSNLTQVVNFDTWSRFINNVKHSSIIDHIYVKNPVAISNLNSIAPNFGDHLLIGFTINSSKSPPPNLFKRNWKLYSKEKLISSLNSIDWKIEFDEVQSFWNSFESKLIEVIDDLCPLEQATNSKQIKSKPPKHIKHKLNRRNNLLKKIKTNPNDSLTARTELKILNKEIKKFFYTSKAASVRRGILPGNSKSLWEAVRISQDVNSTFMPDVMLENQTKIPQESLPSVFGNFFLNKVNSITNDLQINNNIYNGSRKITTENKNFMSGSDILDVLSSIKIKNCEGFDRIPQRILVDGADVLIHPLSNLFSKIYLQQKLPEQWLISKIIPIHKKGPKNHVENYRPIANLCSTSKIFERLILKRIQTIELENNIDLTGKQQHGFKKNKSTTTLALQIQSLIARALDDDNYVLMASLDLSAAFDVVNIDLLMKRLRIIGLPGDVLSLIDVWLRNRLFYVEIDGRVSKFFDIKYGTIQGSILGPILYAIYVSPLFDITDLSNFADDNYALTWSKSKNSAIALMENKISTIINWLSGSGLKVNEEKTELCLFYRKDSPTIEITINNKIIKSSNVMNVLGVTFDSKLNWSAHISNQINKANKALHAIRLIKKFFTTKEILTLITANFYSILFYNSEVWHLPTLKPEIKQHLLSASANALKIAQNHPDRMESFINIHNNAKRATPEKLLLFKHAVLLHKLFNNQTPSLEWADLHFKQTFNSRQSQFRVVKTSNYKIGNNILTNRLSVLNNKIVLDDLNLSLNTFKCKYKQIFLK